MTAAHGLAVCDPRHLLAAPRQPVIPPVAAWVRGWAVFGQGRWPGRARDFTWFLAIALICIAVSHQTRGDSIKTVL